MATQKKNILTRFYLVAVFMTMYLLAIILRVINLQYVQGDAYRKLATELTIRQDTIYANKGNVYAADGNLLATSMSKFNVFMDLVTVDPVVFEKHVKGLSVELSNMLGSTASYYEKTLRRAKNKKRRYFLITRNIGYTDYLKMREFPIFNLGVYKGGFIAKQRTERAHPIGKIAARTIGYDDFRGEAGIEGAFAAYMQGENGLRWEQKIAKNQWKPIADYNEKEPIDGHDIITTIDVNIQDITHHALLRRLEYFEADHGCAVVMETATGEIKAISNLGITKKGTYYEKRNYAVWESHEPGSTFKLMALTAALEDKVIDTSDVVDTKNGILTFYGKPVRDSKHGGYGKISIAKAFEVSSNTVIVAAIDKAYKNQPSKFVERLYSMNLNNDLDLPLIGEPKPIIPDPRIKNGRWSGIALQWMAYGYGVSFTPLQTLTFYNAIANDGEMVKPQFLREVREFDKTIVPFKKEVINPQICSKETILKVKQLLKEVVEKPHGTGHKLYSPNFSMAGKTGTCQKDYAQKDKLSYISSFAGFFPAENPKYSCIVVIHEPKKEKGYYGATVAAPVFKEIAQKIYTTTPIDNQVVNEQVRFAEIEKAYLKYEDKLQENYSKIPNVRGMSGMDALSLLENIGLKVKISGVGKVQSQSLKKGTKLIKGRTIILKLS